MVLAGSGVAWQAALEGLWGARGMEWQAKLIFGTAAIAIGGGDLTFSPDGYEAVSPGVVLFLGVLLLVTGWGDRQTERQRWREDWQRAQEDPKPRGGGEAKPKAPKPRDLGYAPRLSERLFDRVSALRRLDIRLADARIPADERPSLIKARADLEGLFKSDLVQVSELEAASYRSFWGHLLRQRRHAAPEADSGSKTSTSR
jgi:hypothetical protein